MSQPQPSLATLLFLCTGNYYRSRYAEILFSALALRTGLPWRGDSRGLAPEYGFFHTNPIATAVLRSLHARGIQSPASRRGPRKLLVEDLERAGHVIALKEAEHRPLLRERFPGWEDRVEYWHVHDIDCAAVPDTLAAIECQVEALVRRLSEHRR